MKDDTFLRLIGSGVRDTTAEKYVKDLDYIERTLETDLDNMNQADYDRLLYHFTKSIPENRRLHPERTEAMANSTRRSYLFALKAYFRAYSMKDKLGMFGKMPKTSFKKPKPTIEVTIDIPIFYNKIWAYNPKEKPTNPFYNIRNRFMIVACVPLSGRRSELNQLLIKDMHKDMDLVDVVDTKGRGKDSAPIPIPVTSDYFWLRFDEYMAKRKHIPGEYLFCKLDGQQLTKGHVNEIFRMYTPVIRELGIKNVNLTPHLLRRSYDTYLASHLSLKEAMYMSRHKSVGSFKHYLDLALTANMKDNLLKNDILNIG